MNRVPNEQLLSNLPLSDDWWARSPHPPSNGQGIPIGACVVDFAKNRVLAVNGQIQRWAGNQSDSIMLEHLCVLLPGLADKAAALFGEESGGDTSGYSWQTDLVRDQELATQAWVSLIPMASEQNAWHLLLVQPAELPSQLVSYTDVVTGLPDRRVLEGWRQQWRARKPGDECPHALLFLDLNEFKQVNDQHGHACGDHILAVLAERWRDSLRSDDLIVRYGGDEFIALLAGVQSFEEAMPVVERLKSRAEIPFEVEGQSIAISVSIGMALANSVAVPLEELLASADRDMYTQKQLANSRHSQE